VKRQLEGQVATRHRLMLWPFCRRGKTAYPDVSFVARVYAIFTAHLLPEEQIIILEKR